jgi:hypothetical protein
MLVKLITSVAVAIYRILIPLCLMDVQKAATALLMEKCNLCMFEPNGYIFKWNPKQQITLKTQSSGIWHHADWQFNTSASKETVTSTIKKSNFLGIS